MDHELLIGVTGECIYGLQIAAVIQGDDDPAARR